MTYTACYAVGDFIYVLDTDNHTLTIWDVCDPENPVLMATPFVLPDESPQAITVYRGIAFIACASGAIMMVNVDDPTAPELIVNVPVAGESWTRIIVSGGTIFVSGGHVGLYTAEADTALALVEPFDAGSDGVAGICLQGRRLFIARNNGTLMSFRAGGFFCPEIETGTLQADEIAAEMLRVRHVYAKGEMVASQLTVMGGTCETDTGVGNFANYIKLGDKFIFWAETAVDPNGNFTASKGSLFLSGNGNVYRNTDAASAWTAT